MKKSKRVPTRQEATIRNVRAANRKSASLAARVAALEARMAILETAARSLTATGLHSFSG